MKKLTVHTFFLRGTLYTYTMAHGPDTEELLRRLANVRHYWYEIQKLTELNIYGLQITSLPELPSYLKKLCCSHTQIPKLPSLPSSLVALGCHSTQITELPPLPDSLREIYCSHTQITKLPSLPSSLSVLSCHNTQITELPQLPASLLELGCQNTLITGLPPLPSSLTWLGCSNIQITELPPLPDSMQYLSCNNCPNLLIKPMEGEIIQAYEERWKPIREERDSKKRCQDRCLTVKEELMAAAWHPDRVEKWLEIGGFELLD